ncbi:hypothetical protein HYPSUDRAFT_78609 [Hypholoma sublateritium FD-334 SS-4]|uniref:MARVEL domain-containing protein n=1 Tax=Hypholoma sublateritium (strain FD-334 SS-4) TaxID=945553 RepID=A0A0D2M8Z5_HYPSF|nr:hypothetical protein HYPSUDRAFT_78609 [Hypholoma sublateritium FD-334 SS-4]
MSLKQRTTFYSITLALSIVTMGVALSIALMSTFSHVLWIFGAILSAISFISWIWISVLLGYNNRPASSHALTKAAVHFYSFLPMILLYFVLGIMVLSQVGFNCGARDSDGEAPGWCGSEITGGVVSIATSVFASLSAWSIWMSVGGSSLGLGINVASGDGKLPLVGGLETAL